MSANNWRVCPACKRKAEADREKAMAEAARAYGNVPPDEWKAMADRASKPVNLSDDMREDWHIGLNEAGLFSVSYRADCSECPFVFTFKHEQQASSD
jgi:hypothetical protein